MATNNNAVVRELLDLAQDIMRRTGDGRSVDGPSTAARLDDIKSLLGTATVDDLDRENAGFRASGGDGGGP